MRFPRVAKAAYVKFKHPASRFAIVGVCVASGTSGVRVGVTGAASCAFRATAIEAALAKSFTPAAAGGGTAGRRHGQRHAGAEYRAALVGGVMAARAVERALSR